MKSLFTRQTPEERRKEYLEDALLDLIDAELEAETAKAKVSMLRSVVHNLSRPIDALRTNA